MPTKMEPTSVFSLRRQSCGGLSQLSVGRWFREGRAAGGAVSARSALSVGRWFGFAGPVSLNEFAIFLNSFYDPCFRQSTRATDRVRNNLPGNWRKTENFTTVHWGGDKEILKFLDQTGTTPF